MSEQGPSREAVTVTVCAACLQASCWQGVFLCTEAYGADITEKTIDELAALKLEHPSWWDIDERYGVAKRVVMASGREVSE